VKGSGSGYHVDSVQIRNRGKVKNVQLREDFSIGFMSTFHLPPRERKEDIPLLTELF
jgi:hypothetical protein